MIDQFKSAMWVGPDTGGLESASWHGAGQKVSREEADRIDFQAKQRREWQEYWQIKQAHTKQLLMAAAKADPEFQRLMDQIVCLPTFIPANAADAKVRPGMQYVKTLNHGDYDVIFNGFWDDIEKRWVDPIEWTNRQA